MKIMVRAFLIRKNKKACEKLSFCAIDIEKKLSLKIVNVCVCKVTVKTSGYNVAKIWIKNLIF